MLANLTNSPILILWISFTCMTQLLALSIVAWTSKYCQEPPYFLRKISGIILVKWCYIHSLGLEWLSYSSGKALQYWPQYKPVAKNELLTSSHTRANDRSNCICCQESSNTQLDTSSMSPFIHSGHFYSAPSSLLQLRGSPDYSTDTVSEFHAEAQRQLHVKDLPKVPAWRQERESNPRPSGWKSSSQQRHYHVYHALKRPTFTFTFTTALERWLEVFVNSKPRWCTSSSYSLLQWSNYRKISKRAHIQMRKSVGLHNFGGQILKKLGKVQAPKARSCDCRRQEAPAD